MATHNSSPFSALLLRRAQATINRWIAHSSAASEELQRLEGHSMIVDVDNTSWRIALCVEDRQLRLREADTDTAADIVIAAGLSDFVTLVRAETLSQLGAGEVEFRGSLRVAERFGRIFRLARPQLEDELAGWIGGIPARALTRAGGAALAWGAKSAGALERDVAEYLQAETRELPRPGEVAEFLSEVERLRDDVERAVQRIDRLARGRVDAS